MASYRQVVYMILDEIKLISNDSTFTEDHVVFLANNYRNFLIKQKLDKEGESSLSTSNEQTICIDLEPADAFEGLRSCNEQYLKSVQTIPELMKEDSVSISLLDYFGGNNMTFVSNERFKHVGFNKYMRNIIYSTLGPDDKLYMKSQNAQFLNLERVKVTGIFEDSAEAAALSCDENGTVCDFMDTDFPLEAAMLPQLIELCVKELLGAAYRPADDVNNSADDLSDIASFIRRNMKSNLSKQIDGE